MFAQRLAPAIRPRTASQLPALRCVNQSRTLLTKSISSTPALVRNSRNDLKQGSISTLSSGPSRYRQFHVTSLLNEGATDSINQKTMVAFRYYPGETTAVRETLPIPTPKPDEVVIKILAGGVCHSDLGILDPSGSIGEWHNPFTLGHEGAGIITSLGSNVSKTYPNLKEGTYVGVLGPDPCFEPSCNMCSQGKDNLCTTTDEWYGIGRDGAWAEYCAVRAICCIPVPGTPETVPPEVVAVATDAVLTPYHALKTCDKLTAGQTIVVVGAGGLGHNAIQIAKNVLGAGTVVAVDPRETSLVGAKEAGADYGVSPDDLSSLIKEKKLTVDLVVDFVGTQTSFDTALGAVKPAGTIHIVGLMAPFVKLPLMQAVLKDLTVKTSFWGCKTELAEVLDAVAKGKITPQVETKPLEQCLEVLKEFHEGKVKGRIALVP
ncbi:chaperonin 10-like protein [Abortiporus biennis]|nr:chaperonin 10-like protein [Abortiporus biennis]